MKRSEYDVTQEKEEKPVEKLVTTTEAPLLASLEPEPTQELSLP